MRKFLAVLLALATALGVIPALADRGSVIIVDKPLEDDDPLGNEESAFYEDESDWIVYDPFEEYLFDEELFNASMDTLDGMKNILLLGIDSRSSSSFEGRSDTMILLTVNTKNKTIKLTSFLRDLYVEIPGRKNNRLNAAYAFGGFDLLAKTFEKNFGIKPDAYIAVNLHSLATLIDQLGGVYVDVDAKKIDRINAVIYYYNKQVLGLSESRLKDGYLTKGGRQLLNGKQAESWARYRYSESDYQRATRQRQLLQIIYEKIQSMSVTALISFARNNMHLVKTNLSIDDMISLVPSVLALRSAEFKEMRIPVDGGATSSMISGMSVLVPDRNKNVNALKKFLLDD